MQIPSAADLVAEKFLRPPTTARGIYLDRRPGQSDVHMRFVWAVPDRWVWLHLDGPTAGSFTDGKTTVVVEDGVAVVVTTEGEVGATHRLTNLLQPRNYDFSDWHLGAVSAGMVMGRDAWITSAISTMPDKSPTEVIFDVESGVLLRMRTEDSYLGFEELELDETIPEQTFGWDGPVEPRRIGSALVTRQDDDTYSALWQVWVRGRPMFHANGPTGSTKDEAISWAKSRAAKVHVREE